MRVLSGGVMVAQESLELFVMVRIHAGQPVFFRKNEQSSLADTILTREPKESAEELHVKWPKKVKHRNKGEAWFAVSPGPAANVLPLSVVTGEDAH